MKLIKYIVLTSVFLLCGCDLGFNLMGPTEYGVSFRRLPPLIGGGVATSIAYPGQRVWIWPWEEVYRFDGSVQLVQLGDIDEHHEKGRENYVYTRARDGNEVAIAMTVRFQLSTDPQRLARLVQEVATDDRGLRELVFSTGRAAVRARMNTLRTFDYIATDANGAVDGSGPGQHAESARFKAVDAVKKEMEQRLNPFGVEIVSINLDDFRFERLLKDGTVDDDYQRKLNEIQRMREETQREESRIRTVRADRERKLNDAQAKVNRDVEEARGYKEQATSRGDSYLQARTNDALAIKAQGSAEVEGLVQQIAALAGPGGQAILRLDVAKELNKSDSRFVVMNKTAGGVDVSRTDTNQLMTQLGVLDALQPTAVAPVKNEAPKQKTDLPQSNEGEKAK